MNKNTIANGWVTNVPHIDICSNAKLSNSLLPPRPSPVTAVIPLCIVGCELSTEFSVFVYPLPKLRKTSICNCYD